MRDIKDIIATLLGLIFLAAFYGGVVLIIRTIQGVFS